MKNILFALLLIPGLIFGQELATYSIEVKLDGMTVPGAPPGVGDKTLTFIVYLDPTNAETAEEMWYTHLFALFGPDDQAELKAFSEQLLQGVQQRR